jgi:glycosyltransferase involved in cell wall biosynthesis
MTNPLKVSVIIATYNRKDFLRKALLSYNCQTYKNFDVIVASDGSSDGTKEMVFVLQNELKYSLKYIEQEDKGFRKSLILNKAIILSDSEYLIFADDDCIAPPKFIEVHGKKTSVKKCVLGKYLMVNGKKKHLFSESNIRTLKYIRAFTLFDFLDMLYWKIKYRVYFLQNHPKRPRLVGGNFSVYKKALIDINGFDCDFVGWGYEDDDIKTRLVRSGLSLDEVVLSGYNFNLGDETNRTPRQTSQETILKQKEMAYSKERPWRCVNGLDKISQHKASALDLLSR